MQTYSDKNFLRMKMVINDRILAFIEKKGLNKNSFSTAVGIQSQTLHHIVGGRRTKPSYEVLEKIISTYSDINPIWLILGEGPMILRPELSDELRGERPLMQVAEPIATYGKGNASMLQLLLDRLDVAIKTEDEYKKMFDSLLRITGELRVSQSESFKEIAKRLETLERERDVKSKE